MTFKTSFISAGVAVLMATTASAGETKIMIEDAYARSSNPRVAAAFMTIMNHGDTADRLIEARSDVAARVELHTHIINTEGVARMVEVKEGFSIAPGEQADLKRGGDHVMFMGLTAPLENGDIVPVTLVFEQAGELKMEIAVDNDRAPQHGAHGHGGHNHGDHATN